ncbi:site-specific integrase [Alicyclobacillus macrosporangiidus]|uniref:site-specific integrase n=1 Tax=Alicyclobacillus macrosporangiidus TaxID=392015 RepID=UPI000495C0BD|nr:site-specific integrase [Alicyclobacillus macrosporangiidus]
MRGHVRKRGTKWAAVVYLGYDEHGKKRYKWHGGFNTKKEAQNFLAQTITELEKGEYVEPAKETVGSYLERWLEIKRESLRHGTYRKYEWLIRRHILPNLGKIELAKLRPQHLERFYTELRDRLSKRSILHAHLLLHAALDRAVKQGLVSRNVADTVEAPRADAYRATIWTPAEVARFLAESRDMEPGYWIAWVLAVYTGMRQAEILGLKWSDIDWTLGYLRVDRTLKYVRGEPVFQDPKTERSRRSIALSSDTMEALRWHRQQQDRVRLQMGDAYDDQDMVLATAYGRPLSQNTLAHVWQRLLAKIDVPRIRFHDLRHTHASLLLQQGVQAKVVSERLGHSTITTTLDTYTHVVPVLQKEAAERLDELFRDTKISKRFADESEDKN